MNKKVISHLVAFILGASALYFVGRPNVPNAEALTEEARKLNQSADKHFMKAVDQEYKFMINQGIISKKDREIADLKNKLTNASPDEELSTLKAVVIQQEEAISLRDNQINTLRIQNGELKQALLAQERAYEVQLQATKAYSEAMAEAKWKGGFKGAIIGLAVGFVAGKQ
jgi:hypothetical protein